MHSRRAAEVEKRTEVRDQPSEAGCLRTAILHPAHLFPGIRRNDCDCSTHLLADQRKPKVNRVSNTHTHCRIHYVIIRRKIKSKPYLDDIYMK